MNDLVHVKGLAALGKLMDELAPKLQRNVMRSALRAGAKVVQVQAQANIHSVSGLLARGLKLSTGSRGTEVTASVKAKGPHGFVAKFVEYGTRPHTITARDGGAMRFGGGFYRSVEHPGIVNPHPFLRKALDTQAQAAVIAVGEQMKRRFTNEGLNVADVLIEGDEP